MLKIRLMRIGGKKKPFYRVVAVDERSKRTGGYVELLGTYNPLTEPKEIKLKQDRIDYWIKMGAQPSVGYLRIIGKAPQRPPRKAKKEKKEEPKPAEETTPQVEEAPSNVIASEAKQSTTENEIATEPSAPRNDESGTNDNVEPPKIEPSDQSEPVATEEPKKEEKKDERPS